MQDKTQHEPDPKNYLIDKLTDLFAEAGRAHHEAFVDTGGIDLEWPIWYAEYLHPKMDGLFDRELTRSEIVYCLVALSRRQPAEASEKPWTEYYARFFAAHYTT